MPIPEANLQRLVANFRAMTDLPTISPSVIVEGALGKSPSQELINEAIQCIAKWGRASSEAGVAAREAIRNWAVSTPSQAANIAAQFTSVMRTHADKLCAQTLQNIMTGLIDNGMVAEAEQVAGPFMQLAQRSTAAEGIVVAAQRNPALASAIAAAGAKLAAGSLPLLPIVLAAVLALAASGAGLWMYNNWGKPSSEPVQPVPAKNRPQRQPTQQPNRPPTNQPPNNRPPGGTPTLTGKWIGDGTTEIDMQLDGTSLKATYAGGNLTGTVVGSEVNVENHLGNRYKGTLSADGNTIELHPNGGNAAFDHTWRRK